MHHRVSRMSRIFFLIKVGSQVNQLFNIHKKNYFLLISNLQSSHTVIHRALFLSQN